MNLKDECTHNREHRVHSISHRAYGIDTPHLCTCTPSHESSFPVPLPIVLTHVLAPLGPLLLLLTVLTNVLALRAPLLQWLISRCWLIALVLAPLAPLLLLLVVMTHVLAPLAPLLQWLVSRCWLIALVLAPLAPF